MPITLAELRQNPAKALAKLQTSHAYYCHDPRTQEARRLDVRERVRRARTQYRDGQLVGELRNVARLYELDVPTLLRLSVGGRVH